MRVTGVSKRELREAIVDMTGGCGIQHNGWPCGTCFGFTAGALDDGQGPYAAAPWHAILAYRGDYNDYIKGDAIEMAEGIERDENGKFVRHITIMVPLADVKKTIVRIAKKLGVYHTPPVKH